MNVQYTLDYEDGIDPTDPLGDLKITDDSGGSLLIEETFIDVWLLSFLNSILNIKPDETLKVEVLEEPYFVSLTEKDGALAFNYNDQVINTGVKEAILGFEKTAKELIVDLSGYSGVEKNLTIMTIKELLSNNN